MSNKSAEFLEIASGILESAVGALLKAADSGETRRLSPTTQSELEEEDSIDTFLAQAGTTNGFFDVSMDTSDFT